MNHAKRKPHRKPIRGQWLLWAVITLFLAVGAGAATGLILEDSVEGISGNSSLGVNQSLAVTNVTAMGDNDGFIATIDDDQVSFAAHMQVNNGDRTGLSVEISNLGGIDDITFQFIIHYGDGPFSFSIVSDDTDGEDTDGDGTVEPVVRTGMETWVSKVGAGSTNTLDVTVAVEDAAAPGFYELSYEIKPMNV